MDRRTFLQIGGVASGLALAGCLERLGFEQQSAWRDPPLVEDRPDAVYHPAATEDMGVYAVDDDGEYAVALSYTFPHRFWTVTGSETNRVVVESDDTLHLMVSVWDHETEHILPVDMHLEVLQGDTVVEEFTPWPMISQRMGFHYGDNAILPGEGEYTAHLRVGPIQARRLGQFAGRFEETRMFDLEFEYSRDDIHDLEFEVFESERHGQRDALPLMEHGEHHEDEDHDNTGEPPHPPVSASPDIDELSGTHIGTERSGDADFELLETDSEDWTDEERYLAVFPKTPYNEIILPLTALSVSIERDNETVLEPTPFEETLTDSFGHHYGLGIPVLNDDDQLTLTVDSPPAISRHDGYETAFFEFEDLEFVR